MGSKGKGWYAKWMLQHKDWRQDLRKGIKVEIMLGSVQVLYEHVRGDWRSDGNAYFAYVVRVYRQNAYNAYVKDQNSYSPGNGF